MLKAAEVVENLMNCLGRGLIYADQDRRIQICNQMAREIIGIDFDCAVAHEGGNVLPGDIVIIADNHLGDDDGGMTGEELALVNIRDKNIRPGDMILGVGVYQNKKIEPVCKYVRDHQLCEPFALDVNYLGFHIASFIDPLKKRMGISVNGSSFEMDYFQSIGHMVVIDGTNGHIKFFQMQGYSVRKEAIGTLLRGGSFLKKGNVGDSPYPIIGKKMSEVFEQSELTEKVYQLLDGREDHIRDALYEINRRPFLCSLIAIKKEESKGTEESCAMMNRQTEESPGGENADEAAESKDAEKVSGTAGVFVMLQDARSLEALLEDRNRIIGEIEKKHHSAQTGNRNDFPPGAFQGFVGDGPLIQDVKYLACKASKTRFNVIITGESGTGKSQLAWEIHRMQNREGPFVEVNCNAIAPTLFESELFGYAGGAFTGAAAGGKAGYFEAADGGTIFLDEIGEIPLEIQVKLLQVLQSKTIYRVGSSRAVKVDVRVIAATNRNLEQEVLRGTFRQDLFYRINVFPIDIPPLRERKADLYLLINQILRRVCRQYDIPIKQFSGEAYQKMLSYSWPGNVRELENVIERAITLCETDLIYPEHISIAGQKCARTMKELLAEEERRILQEALIRYRGDRRQVMEELALSKSVFYDKCKRYGIG